MPTRRHFLATAGAAAMTACLPARAFETVAPAAAGFSTDLADRFAAFAAAGRLPGLHGVVALRHGRIFFERYLAGEDANWGTPLGRVEFGPETLHDLRSVTKSIVGLLYGIALAEGRVPAPDRALLAQFPEYPDLAADPARTGLTVEHVLTMTLGTEWNESLPYTSLANSEIAMEAAPDRWRFVLERPVVAAPGAGWTYNGGATALLGRLIERGTGQSLPDYARAVLFDPLGIGPTEWVRGRRDGVASAASGLRMRPRDLARIGQMVLDRGMAGDRRIVPAEWLAASFRPLARLPDGRGYGYHWYLGRFDRGGFWRGAIGNGGQRLFVWPEPGLVVAVTAGNYDDPEQWRTPIDLVREVLLPALAG
ncbi:serine hydrolase domain-containing protein [Stella sp.]|uniref:serine hydrolase domain-containing protein n=1 Tax=Stella sp. TaxID=2912054 RepID=UPI0035B36BF6